MDKKQQTKQHPSKTAMKPLETVLYDYTSTPIHSIYSFDDLRAKQKSLEFCNLMGLPLSEIILQQEPLVYYFSSVTSTSLPGSVYLSRNFVSFIAFTPTLSQFSLSMLWETPQEQLLNFTIVILLLTFSHLVKLCLL